MPGEVPTAPGQIQLWWGRQASERQRRGTAVSHRALRLESPPAFARRSRTPFAPLFWRLPVASIQDPAGNWRTTVQQQVHNTGGLKHPVARSAEERQSELMEQASGTDLEG